MALIARYPMNWNANDVVSSLNWTASNVTWVDGKENGAGSFNWTNSYISINDDNLLSFTNKIWSAVCIFSTTQTTHWQFISKWNTSNFEWSFYIWQTWAWKVWAEMWTSAWASLWKWDTTWTYNDWKWHVAWVTFNNAQPILYIDWVAVAMSWSGTWWTSTNWTANVNIGRRADWNQYFNWKLDFVCLYNNALTPAEMKNIYLSLNWYYG